MDFPIAQLPSLRPLASSFAENDIEADLKQLFLDLFSDQLAVDSFDVNVLGVPHLGSFDLVRRAVNLDGLVLLQGDQEEASTRYLYRAWKSGDIQGRGIHFLRTYLNLLFPGLCEVTQLWQDKSQPYPTALFTGQPRTSIWLYALGEPGLKLNGRWSVGGSRAAEDFEAEANRIVDMSGMFLTSRIDIALDFSVAVQSTSDLMHIIRSVIPARLLPIFRFMLSLVLSIESRMSTRLLMEKHSRMRYPWCGRVVGDADDVRWSLGCDGALVKLPQEFGTFRLGEARGGLSKWRLKGCRIGSSAVIKSAASAGAYRLPKLGETGRRLDATWLLGGRSAEAAGYSGMAASSQITVLQSLITTYHEHARMDYPGTPAKLGAVARLAPWRRLNGNWRVGMKSSPRPFGFRVRRGISVVVETAVAVQSTCEAYVSPEKLTYFQGRALKLNGDWGVGAPAAPEFFFRAEKV